MSKLNALPERAPAFVALLTLFFCFCNIFFLTSAITFNLPEPAVTPLISPNVNDVDPSEPDVICGVVSITPVPKEAVIELVFTKVPSEIEIAFEFKSNNCFTTIIVSVVVLPVFKVLTAACGNLNTIVLLPTSNRLPAEAKSPIKF